MHSDNRGSVYTTIRICTFMYVSASLGLEFSFMNATDGPPRYSIMTYQKNRRTYEWREIGNFSGMLANITNNHSHCWLRLIPITRWKILCEGHNSNNPSKSISRAYPWQQEKHMLPRLYFFSFFLSLSLSLCIDMKLSTVGRMCLV